MISDLEHGCRFDRIFGPAPQVEREYRLVVESTREMKRYGDKLRGGRERVYKRKWKWKRIKVWLNKNGEEIWREKGEEAEERKEEPTKKKSCLKRTRGRSGERKIYEKREKRLEPSEAPVRARVRLARNKLSPGIECVILSDNGGQDVKMECLADTGCDYTVVAEDVANKLGTIIRKGESSSRMRVVTK